MAASVPRMERYYERLLKEMNEKIPIAPKLRLVKLRISSSPKLSGPQCVLIEMDNKQTHKSLETKIEGKKKGYDVIVGGIVEGDCKITLALNSGGKKLTKICHFWFSTGFTDNFYVKFEKSTIDVANKDKKCKVFKDDFFVEGYFEAWNEKDFDKVKSPNYEDPSLEDKDPSDDGESLRKRGKSFYDYEEYKDLNLDLEESAEVTSEEDDHKKIHEKKW